MKENCSGGLGDYATIHVTPEMAFSYVSFEVCLSEIERARKWDSCCCRPTGWLTTTWSSSSWSSTPSSPASSWSLSTPPGPPRPSPSTRSWRTQVKSINSVGMTFSSAASRQDIYLFNSLILRIFVKDCDMTYAHFCRPTFWGFWHPGSSPGDRQQSASFFTIYPIFLSNFSSASSSSILIQYHLIRVSLAGSWSVLDKVTGITIFLYWIVISCSDTESWSRWEQHELELKETELQIYMIQSLYVL